MNRSHYEVLDVPTWATRDQIRRAYVRLARQAHPDAGGTEETMRALNDAWAVLGDPASRRTYDRTIDRDDDDDDERVFVATGDGPVRTGIPPDDVDLDDFPIRVPNPRLPILGLAAVAMFAASVAFYALGIVFSARHLLAIALILFIAATLMMIIVPFAEMTRSRRR